MKITKKKLENIIIEEISKILQERPSELDMDVTPGLRPEGYRNLHQRLVALEKAAKSAGWKLDLKPTKNDKNDKNDSAPDVPDWKKLGYKSSKAYHVDMVIGMQRRGKIPDWKRLGYKSEEEYLNYLTDIVTGDGIDDFDDDIDDRSDEDID